MLWFEVGASSSTTIGIDVLSLIRSLDRREHRAADARYHTAL